MPHLSLPGTNTLPDLKGTFINRTGGATVKGGVYAIDVAGSATESTTAETNLQSIVAVATANLNMMLVVALGVYADDAPGLYQMVGVCDALVDGDTNDVAEGTWLIGENATTAFTSQADSVVTRAFAIALEANTGAAALKKVYVNFQGFSQMAAS